MKKYIYSSIFLINALVTLAQSDSLKSTPANATTQAKKWHDSFSISGYVQVSSLPKNNNHHNNYSI